MKRIVLAVMPVQQFVIGLAVAVERAGGVVPAVVLLDIGIVVLQTDADVAGRRESQGSVEVEKQTLGGSRRQHVDRHGSGGLSRINHSARSAGILEGIG